MPARGSSASADTGGGRVGGSSTTPTRPREPGLAPTDSPVAKRPATMTEPTAPSDDAPEMPTAQMSRAIYALQRKFASVEEWATSVNSAMVDHASHIDSSRAFNVVAGRQLDSTVGQVDLLTTNLQTTTRDLVDLATQADANDAFLKGQVAAAVQLLGAEMEKLNGNRVKDLDALAKALDVQVRIVQGDLATLLAA